MPTQLSDQLHSLLSFLSITQEGNAGRFGVIAGRVVNRIANATFTLDGTRYQVRPGLRVLRDTRSTLTKGCVMKTAEAK